MTKKDTELPVTTSFLKTDVIAVTTGVAAMTPVTKQMEAEDVINQLSDWRTETVVIETHGFEEEPEVGDVEGIVLSLPFDCVMLGIPYAAIMDQAGGVDSTTGPFEIDILKNGTSVLSTNITIDQGELNSSTAATPPVVSDATYDAFDQWTFEVIDAGVDVLGPIQVMFQIRRV